MKLNIKAFALSCGLIWGLGLFFLTWWLILLEGAEPAGCFLNRVYPGYTMTPPSAASSVWPGDSSTPASAEPFSHGSITCWWKNVRNLNSHPNSTQKPEWLPFCGAGCGVSLARVGKLFLNIPTLPLYNAAKRCSF